MTRNRCALAALIVILIALPTAAQTGSPPIATDPTTSWTGSQIGNQQHRRNERGEEWPMMPPGDKQKLLVDPAGRSQVCVRTGPVINCRWGRAGGAQPLVTSSGRALASLRSCDASVTPRPIEATLVGRRPPA